MTKTPVPQDLWERVKTLDKRLTHLERGGKGNKGIIDGAVNFYSESGDLQLKVGKLENGTVGIRRYTQGEAVDDASFNPLDTAPVIGGPIGEGVENVVATAGVRTLMLEWDAIEEFPELSYYEIQIATDEEFTDIVHIGRTQATLFGWEPSGNPQAEPYWSRVRAVDRHGGATEWSDLDSATLAFSVLESDLNDAAVSTRALADLAVDVNKLADLAVEAEKLAGEAVSDPTKIANAAVGSAAIAQAAIGTLHVANGVLTSVKMDVAEINNAQVWQLVADNILAGSLTAVIDVTSGLIRTSASGTRVELANDGFDIHVAQADAKDSEQEISFFRLGDGSPVSSIDTTWSLAGNIGFNFTLLPKDDSVLNDMMFTVFDASGNPRTFTAYRDTPKIEHNIYSTSGVKLVNVEFQVVDPRIDLQVGSVLRMAFWHGSNLIAFNANEYRFLTDLSGSGHLFSVQQTPNNGDTSLAVRYRDHAGIQNFFARVSVGGLDSGGSGYRVLRVPNST